MFGWLRSRTDDLPRESRFRPFSGSESSLPSSLRRAPLAMVVHRSLPAATVGVSETHHSTCRHNAVHGAVLKVLKSYIHGCIASGNPAHPYSVVVDTPV
ncbi:hypothetical protein ZWY2020_035634 [Hordeum vulgare]|nr:hypothetical protein ZWY2020_035634 [Hordeum vulgare]